MVKEDTKGSTQVVAIKITILTDIRVEEMMMTSSEAATVEGMMMMMKSVDITEVEDTMAMRMETAMVEEVKQSRARRNAVHPAVRY